MNNPVDHISPTASPLGVNNNNQPQSSSAGGRVWTWLKSAGSKIVEFFKKIFHAIFPFLKDKTVQNNAPAAPAEEPEELYDDELELPEEHNQIFDELIEKLNDSENNKADISQLFKKLKKLAPRKTTQMDEDVRQLYIDRLNELRAPYFGADKRKVDGYFHEINSITLSFVRKLIDPSLSDDMDLFMTPEIRNHDGQIMPVDKDHPTHGNINPKYVKKAWDAVNPASAPIPKISFHQEKSLSQVNSSNYFCGYYALFSLLQSVCGQSFSDVTARENFNTLFPDWYNIKARKTIETFLERSETVESQYDIPPDFLSALTPEEICDIIKRNNQLKHQTNWYVIDVAEEISPDSRALGLDEQNNIYPIERNHQKSDFPLFLVVKQANSHYYFVKVDKKGNNLDLTITNSMPGNIRATWKEKHWVDLLSYIFRVGK